jgi:hypothetical protein
MNNNASKITFWVTCVVESMVTTHFLNPLEGMASSRSRLMGENECDNDSALRSVSVDSNQNKQVIYFTISIASAKGWPA